MSAMNPPNEPPISGRLSSTFALFKHMSCNVWYQTALKDAPGEAVSPQLQAVTSLLPVSRALRQCRWGKYNGVSAISSS